MDHLYFFLTAITLFFTVMIFSTIFFFMVKFRRRSPDERPADTKTYLALELTWTIVPTLISVVIFVWASSLYFENSRPPEASTEIFVVGKQWMWHLQHPEGVREINELARAGERADQDHHDVRGRDPRFLHPGVSREKGRDSRPL